MIDIKSTHKVVKAISFQAIAADGATVSALIDVSDFNGVMFVAACGARTDGTFTLSAQHCNESDESDIAAVPAGDMNMDAQAGVVNAADEFACVGYVGNKKYVKLTLTASAVSSGAIVGVMVVEAQPKDAPVAD